jgi:NTE family protein
VAQVEIKKRDAATQAKFEGAATTLKEADGWTNPSGEKILRADLVLEGGGVKGIGLAGAYLTLVEAGYSFARVAGTSAGAIASTLIVALDRAGKQPAELATILGNIDYSEFEHKNLLSKLAGSVGAAAHLLLDMGLYNGDYLSEWLTPILEDLHVTTFGHLVFDPVAEGLSPAPGHNSRLLIHASDITRRQLLRMPWDYSCYGIDIASYSLVEAVRASMSIPFFFVPVKLKTNAVAKSADCDEWPGGHVTLVDGGMLSNYPVDCFDTDDVVRAPWPTIGVKLSAREVKMPPDRAADNTLGEAIDCLSTMMSEWDRGHFDQVAAKRTVFVDCGSITATDFNLTAADQQTLFDSGRQAATDFVITCAGLGGVPRP